jgi:hypothetical protein
MIILIWIVSFLIIISKFLDCYTTSTQITDLNQERNPLARKVMERIGIHTTIWTIFGLSIIIVGLSIWVLFVFYNTIVYKVLFISLGTFIAFTQFAVAHTNMTKRLNFFTKILLKYYTK